MNFFSYIVFFTLTTYISFHGFYNFVLISLLFIHDVQFSFKSLSKFIKVVSESWAIDSIISVDSGSVSIYYFFLLSMSHIFLVLCVLSNLLLPCLTFGMCYVVDSLPLVSVQFVPPGRFFICSLAWFGQVWF